MIPFGSFKIGRISGIDIEINYTWFIIFFLVAAALAFAYFPTVYPQLSVTVNIINGVLTAILFFASVLFHELMHSSVAQRNGLMIKKITLFIFGGVSQMEEEPPTAGVEFRMAIAGPLSSIVLAFVFGGIFFALTQAGASAAFFAPYGWLALINALLGVFNMVPGFPLDGGRVFRSILWAWTKDIKKATKIASLFGQGFAYSLIIFGLFMIFRGFLDGLWLILIGWFLNNAARGSYQQLLLRTQLGDVNVEKLMIKDIETIGSDVNLQNLVDDYFVKLKVSWLPVVGDEGKLLGVVSLNDVKAVDQDRWGETLIKEVLQHAPADRIISSKDEAIAALMQMSQENLEQLLVVDEERLVGEVYRKDIVSLLKIKSRLGTEKA
jgi:Zn-dependent protease/CBS domain-containing protein